MTASVDATPYGTHAPDRFVAAIIALTRALPANRLGLRVSMPLRRIALNWLRGRPVDTTLWGGPVRLYPDQNRCEKAVLFTPQMFDLMERNALAAAIAGKIAAKADFVFIDIGANIGAYSLFVARQGGSSARIVAIEPQPGIVDRLTFNTAHDSGVRIDIVPFAVADREGETEMIVDHDDSGGTHLKGIGSHSGTEAVPVRCRPLTAILHDAGVTAIDALKIDVEGAEDLVLSPFLREAPDTLLPRMLLIEDRAGDWGGDLHGLLQGRGYTVSRRSRQNLIFERGARH